VLEAAVLGDFLALRDSTPSKPPMKGMVETARGAVTVKDREGLEECANGLYGIPEALG
jgi:hypothetical protein